MPKQAGSGQAPPYTHTHECQGWTRRGTRPDGTGIGTGTGTGMGTGGESCPPVAAGRTAPLAAPTLPGPGSQAAGTAPGRAAAPVRDGGGWRKEQKSQSRSAGLWVLPAPVLLSAQVGGRARGELPGHSLDHTAAWRVAGCSLVPSEGTESQPAFHLASVGIKILGHGN